MGIILIVIALVFMFWYKQPKTPLEVLEKQYTGKQESIWRYCELIKQIDVSQKESLLFYYNGNGNVNCAVAERKFGGVYKIANVSAELSTYSDSLRAGLFASTYHYKNNYKWVYFGIVYDDAVEKAVWNKTEAIRFSTPDLEMFYAVGSGNFGDEDNGGYHIYDSSGNELEHQWLIK